MEVTPPEIQPTTPFIEPVIAPLETSEPKQTMPMAPTPEMPMLDAPMPGNIAERFPLPASAPPVVVPAVVTPPVTTPPVVEPPVAEPMTPVKEPSRQIPPVPAELPRPFPVAVEPKTENLPRADRANYFVPANEPQPYARREPAFEAAPAPAPISLANFDTPPEPTQHKDAATEKQSSPSTWPIRRAAAAEMAPLPPSQLPLSVQPAAATGAVVRGIRTQNRAVEIQLPQDVRIAPQSHAKLYRILGNQKAYLGDLIILEVSPGRCLARPLGWLELERIEVGDRVEF